MPFFREAHNFHIYTHTHKAKGISHDNEKSHMHLLQLRTTLITNISLIFNLIKFNIDATRGPQ